MTSAGERLSKASADVIPGEVAVVEERLSDLVPMKVDNERRNDEIFIGGLDQDHPKLRVEDANKMEQNSSSTKLIYASHPGFIYANHAEFTVDVVQSWSNFRSTSVGCPSFLCSGKSVACCE
jgi:hypothetical protein